MGQGRELRTPGAGAPRRTLRLAWTTREAEQTCCIVWGDYHNNGDGYLDLACGNKGPNRVHKGIADARPDDDSELL